MNILVIDGCVRGENSRTWALTTAFLQTLEEGKGHNVEILHLNDLELSYFNGERLEQRDQLRKANQLDHPQFRYAHQFAQAEAIVLAAPFWDLSLPAIVKVYIENISVENITFALNDQGIYGICQAKQLVYITTRGGIYQSSPLDVGTKYLTALCEMYGIETMHTIAQEGTDVPTIHQEKSAAAAKAKAQDLAHRWNVENS